MNLYTFFPISIILLNLIVLSESFNHVKGKIEMNSDLWINSISKVKKIVASASIITSGAVSPINTERKFKTPPSIFKESIPPNNKWSQGQDLKAKKESKKTGNSFITDAVHTVGPSVVRIDCEREMPPMMSMFGDQFKEGETIRISGSGFVVTKDGYILTNAHVVDKTKKITITLSNGRVYKTKLVAVDELSDLAVIKADIGSEELKPAPLGDSSKLQSGEWVIAVGCPVGLDFTVTLGIVSNPKRSANEVGAPNMKGIFIQTDAALNQGNSGGPLVNENGEVIGINTMVRTNTEAIGFAIPINNAISAYNILKEGKKPPHSFFGLEVMSISPDWARIYNDDPNVQRLPTIKGALVLRVVPGSPAAIAGLRRHDVIIEVDGNLIKNSDDATSVLDACKPGAPIRIKIARGENGEISGVNATPQDLLSVIEEKRAGHKMLNR